MAVSCTVFEIKRDIGRKHADFSYHLVFNLHDPLEPLRILIENVRLPKLGDCKYCRKVKIYAYNATCDRRQTDGSYHKPNVT